MVLLILKGYSEKMNYNYVWYLSDLSSYSKFLINCSTALSVLILEMFLILFLAKKVMTHCRHREGNKKMNLYIIVIFLFWQACKQDSIDNPCNMLTVNLQDRDFSGPRIFWNFKSESLHSLKFGGCRDRDLITGMLGDRA